MNTQKRAYADVLKNPSACLNPGMDPQPLIRKDQRVRLSDSAKKNLHAAIKGKPMILHAKPATPVIKVKSVTNVSQPLALATASNWVVPGNLIQSAIDETKKESASVNILPSGQIGLLSRGSVKNDPIDVCSDSDNEDKKVTAPHYTPCGMPHNDEMCTHCIDEGLAEVFSIDGMYETMNTSEFDAYVFFNENTEKDEVVREPKKEEEEPMKTQPDLNVSLN